MKAQWGLDMREAADMTDCLGPGIYILWRRGRVVHIDKAKCVLTRVAEHRRLARTSTPDWLPIKGFVFDRFEVIKSHPDRIDAELAGVIAAHANQREAKYAYTT
jgi:hypothetical protein